MQAFIMRHKYLSLGLGIFLAVILLRKSTTVVEYVKAKVEQPKTETPVWNVIAQILGITTGLAIISTLGYALYDGGLSALAALTSVGLAGALMPFRGVTDLFSRSNVIVESLALGSTSGEKIFKIEPSTLVDNGDPIKAKGILLNLKFTLTSATTTPGDPIFERMFGKLLQYVEVWSPLLGTIVDRQYARGPVVYHVMEPVGLGYRKMTPRLDRFSIIAAAPHAITVQMFVPLGTEVLREPLDSYPWVGFLANSEVKINAAAADVLREYEALVTISAMTCSAHLVTCVDRRPERWQIPGSLSLATYYVTCSSGQKQLDFDVGGAGPQACDLTRGERLVFVGLQSNRSGLSGPDNFKGLSRVGCQQLGIQDTLVPDAHVGALCLATGEEGVRRQVGPGGVEYSSPAGADGLFFESGFYNDPAGGGDTETDEGPAGSRLRILPLYAAGRGTKLSQLPVFKPGKMQVNIEKTSMPAAGQWALTVISMRDIRSDKHADLARIAQASGVSDRGTANGKSALKEIISGNADKSAFVGMPFQLTK
jgi:hypothetical protein